MIKNKTVLEVKINDHVYQMECNADCTLGEVHDALHMMKNYIIERMQQVEAQPKAQEEAK